MEQEPRFECVYELHSIDKNHSIRLRVGVPEEDPKVPTIRDLWPAATYPEREIYDMFGLTIEGHVEQSRLLMPEDWGGAIEPFIDIEIDGSFLKVRTDQRYGEVAFQVAYEPLNPSSESTCEVSYIDLMITGLK